MVKQPRKTGWLCVFAGIQPKFSLTSPMVPRTQQRSNTALIKLSLIKVFLILLAGLIDLICFRPAIGCDLYLVNELIDLAPSASEWIQRGFWHVASFILLTLDLLWSILVVIWEIVFLLVGFYLDASSSKKSNLVFLRKTQLFC